MTRRACVASDGSSSRRWRDRSCWPTIEQQPKFGTTDREGSRDICWETKAHRIGRVNPYRPINEEQHELNHPTRGSIPPLTGSYIAGRMGPTGRWTEGARFGAPDREGSGYVRWETKAHGIERVSPNDRRTRGSVIQKRPTEGTHSASDRSVSWRWVSGYYWLMAG